MKENDFYPESEVLLAMWNAMEVGVLLVEARTKRILKANPAFLRMSGKTMEELAGTVCHRHVCPACEGRCPIGDLGQVVDHDERILLHADGHEILVEKTVTPIHIEGRELYLETMVDISRRKSAEAGLAESQRRLSTLMASLPGMAYRCRNDHDWTMEFVSEGCFNLCGYRAEELTRNRVISWNGLIFREDRDWIWRLWQEKLAKREQVTLEYQITCKDGSTRWVWEQGQGVFSPNGEVVALEGFIADITPMRQAQAERELLAAQLNQAQKMESIGRLAGGVAHDFNNMLAVILGHAELALERVPQGDPLRDDLTEILGAARRSSEITRHLLAFARRQTVVPKVIEINQTVQGSLRMLGRLIGENIRLVWQPGDGLPCLRMDPTQVDQILANLCLNARDAIGLAPGTITIETGFVIIDEAACEANPGLLPGEYVTLAVSDDGCGMDPETVAMIFEPFFTTKEVGKGTGLGLPTVYGIAKQNKGFIRVTSLPGQGTTFHVFLRVLSALQQGVCEKQPETEAGHGGRRGTILLVEDEPSILKMTKKMLERMGYAVLAALSPTESLVLAAATEGEIDLVMTDVVMPGMNGPDLVRRLQVMRPGLRVLYMSGHTPHAISRFGVPDSGVSFIQKPFTFQELSEILDLFR